jgi:hypothetical protein
MRTPAVFALLFVAVITTPHRIESQGLGGLIKKKAVEAAKGKDAKSDQGKTVAKDQGGPIRSQFEKECGPVTPDAVDRFLKGLQTEAAQLGEFERKRAAAKPDDQVQACRSNEATSPEALKILQRGMTADASAAQLQAAMNQNRIDLDAYMLKKCGEPVSTYRNFNSYAARTAGAKAAGMSPECYDKLKEFALAFCLTLTPAQQKTATEQGIKVPGKGGAEWVFSVDEARTLAPRCGELVGPIKDTGYKLG